MSETVHSIEQLKIGRELLKHHDANIESVGNASHVWPLYFHTINGKWKYLDYVVMEKYDGWKDFDVLINEALKNTPQEIRETTITEIGSWTVYMPFNPLGFPIMVVGSRE